jgi:hypothetical protein
VLAERTNAAKRLAERERDLRREAGEAFAELVTRWNALADLLSERSVLVSGVALEQLVERVGIFDREARERWQEAAAFVVEPVPARPLRPSSTRRSRQRWARTATPTKASTS